MNVGTVEDEGFQIGDTVRIATANGSHDYTLVGSFTFAGKDDTLGSGVRGVVPADGPGGPRPGRPLRLHLDRGRRRASARTRWRPGSRRC